MTTVAKTNTAMMGHNNPPTDHELIKESMAEKNARVLDRALKLVEAADRVPEKINDRETSDKVTDLEKQISVCYNILENSRKEEKAPYWDMGKVVDLFFGEKMDPLVAAKKRVKKIQTDYLVAEEGKEQKRRHDLKVAEDAARDKAIEDAAKLEGEGKKSQAEAVMEKAVQHDHDAAFFGEAAKQTGAAVVQSQGEMTGAKSSLRHIWTGEIEDRASLDLEPLRYLLSEDALQKAINAYVKNGGRTLKGVKIYQKAEATTR